MPIFGSLFVVVLTIVACVAGAPSRLQDSNIAAYMDAVLARAEVDKAMARNQELLGEPEFQNYNSLLDGDLMRLERTSLDSLSGATFGQSKKFDPSTLTNTRTVQSKPLQKIRVLNAIVPKRNFDEIDRTNFDSFVKKNHIEVPKQTMQSRQLGNFGVIDRGYDDFGRRRFASD